MSRTELPFYDRFIPMIQKGRKTMTARTSRYGEPGDIVVSPAGDLRMIFVEKLPLEEIAEKFFYHEGFDSPGKFVACWKVIHPRKGFDPDWNVWLHHFEFLGGDSGE